MFKKGDVVVSVSDSDIDITIGNKYTVLDASEGIINFKDDDGFYRTRPSMKYELLAREETETQPMVVNISIGAELTHITIGGKRFRLVPEE